MLRGDNFPCLCSPQAVCVAVDAGFPDRLQCIFLHMIEEAVEPKTNETGETVYEYVYTLSP
jgi:hypothetical protein